MNQITASDSKLLYDFLSFACPIEDETFQEALRHFKKRCFTKGEPILKAGQIETCSNLVVKGVVHQYVFDEDVPITINITPRGLSFNSLKSYIEEIPSKEIHEAISDVEILSIEKKELEKLVKSRHDFSYLLYRVYERILLDRENRMFLLQYKSPRKRFALFHEIIERSNWILGDTPEKYIASYLNMTPQQYSREKKHFEKNAKLP